MSKIKELKTDTQNVLNLIDVLELFSPEKKSKYTDTLLRLMRKTSSLDEHILEIKTSLINKFDFIRMEDLNNFSDIQILLMFRFLDSFFNFEDLRSFRKFCEYNERGLISQNDLSKYKSFDDVLNQLSMAEMKVSTKQMESQIVKLMDTDEWLIVRPLTYLASKKYGSNTKWCTTSEGNPEYFIKYSSKGVLIYCINKVTGYKVASFYSLDKNDPEFSFWNQKDSRIDSLDTELTDEIRLLIQSVSKDKKAKTNRFLLSDEQRVIEDKLMKNNSDLFKEPSLIGEELREAISMEEPSPIMEEPVQEERQDRLNPFNQAIERRNEERRARERRLMGELEERNEERQYEDRENQPQTFRSGSL
jgi:hypothetical protein